MHNIQPKCTNHMSSTPPPMCRVFHAILERRIAAHITSKSEIDVGYVVFGSNIVKRFSSATFSCVNRFSPSWSICAFFFFMCFPLSCIASTLTSYLVAPSHLSPNFLVSSSPFTHSVSRWNSSILFFIVPISHLLTSPLISSYHQAAPH